MKLKLYTAAQNSAGERVRIALNLKRVNYEYVSVTTTGADEYLRKNPQALIPTLEVDGININQSLAAIEFIETQFPEPSLLPDNPFQQALSRSFALAICAELHALTVRRVRKFINNEIAFNSNREHHWYKHWSNTTFSALETMLKNRSEVTPFCFADYPTIADIVLVPQLANARRFEIDLTPFPTLTEIESKCAIMPEFAAARPENQMDYKPVS